MPNGCYIRALWILNNQDFVIFSRYLIFLNIFLLSNRLMNEILIILWMNIYQEVSGGGEAVARGL